MDKAQLKATAEHIVANGKGILAADESTGTIGKRFAGINVENVEPNRQAYRQLMFTTPGAEQFIGGVIQYDETLRQSTDDGKPFAQLMNELDVVPGIKVDTGAKELAGHPGEMITEGLDGLRDRLAEYYQLGARFAKWRAVITIDEAKNLPSEYCINANAQALARYAALCQEANIVPIVEPEVIMDGGHSIETCETVTTRALTALFNELKAANVYMEGILLKPNMILSGTENPRQAGVDEVAERTVRVLKNCVPSSVPGVVFLSGGQDNILATQHLQAMNANYEMPWALSYSYGRALQAPALKAWAGETTNIPAAQTAYLLRARNNSAAALANYNDEMENA